jgi:hypothetical protein
MKIHKYLRSISIIAYLLIFLQGMIIQLPFIFVLLSAPFEGEPIMRILVVFADFALIALFVISFQKRTKWSIFIELFIYIILLLPLINIISRFPFEMFNYFLFLFPISCFIIFYPLSVIYSYREFSKIKNQASLI